MTAAPGGRRILVAMLVYNGRSFVPRALESLVRMVDAAKQRGRSEVEVVVLDDASPEPEWSDELAAMCERIGFGCYRSPRNLGIPRNFNLAMLLGEERDADLVVLLNSDVVVPATLADSLADVFDVARTQEGQGHARVASITAWSNNASIFSIPNGDGAGDAETNLAHPIVLDRVSETLAGEFGASPFDLPVGMGFCLAVSINAVREIGLMDPVFGRGYCEEVDWCRRAADAGWRNVLARNVFVYHMGSATTRLAGLLAPGEQTVQVNESIVDERHPTYRDETAAWEATGAMELEVARALRLLVRERARTDGYVLEATWLRRRAPESPLGGLVRITVNPDGPRPLVEAAIDGWRTPIEVGAEGILAAVSAFVGVPPGEVRISDYGSVASQVAEAARAAGVPVTSTARYPARV